MSQPNQPIPEGYMRNRLGHLVALADVTDYDHEKDSLVNEYAAKFIALNAQLAELKRTAFADLAAFAQLAGEKHNVKVGGSKGNLTLYSFSGDYKIERTIAESLAVDEGFMAAKALMIEHANELEERTEDGDMKSIIEWVFGTNSNNEISVTRLQSLRTIKSTGEKWNRAIAIINDSLYVTESKAYVRMFVRVDASGEYKPIPLNIASI